MKKAVTTVLIVAVLFTLFVVWRRYTAYGIFLGGGAGYWIQHAASSSSDTEARDHLRRVINATQYGVNAAENAVRRLPKRDDRVRMWRLLIELAPNENWRRIYQRDLGQERASPEPPHNSALQPTPARAA